MSEREAAQGGAEKPKQPRSTKRKREYAIYLRLTAEEDAQLRAKANAASKTPGTFLRAVIAGHPIEAIPKHPEDYYRNLRQIGNNVNQIAKHLNSGAIPTKSELEETVKFCAEVLKNASR